VLLHLPRSCSEGCALEAPACDTAAAWHRLQGCAEECYSSRISDEARLAALDEEYCSWLEQQATSGTVLLPASAAESSTKLFALTGMLALLRCCEPLSALWSKHLEGTDSGTPVQGTRWNKM
jgi:hypothetical protein